MRPSATLPPFVTLRQGGDWKGNPNPGYAEHIMRMGDKSLTAPATATAGDRQLGTLHLGELTIAPTALQKLEVHLQSTTSNVHFFELRLKPIAP